MVSKLSAAYKKEISFLLFTVFFTSFYSSLKVYGSSGYIPTTFAGDKDGFISYTLPNRIVAKKVDIPTASKKLLAAKTSTDIDGPGQPEMQSFQSVNANNLVDLFSGDFSYNIPLLDVGGYPVNIHYSSGISMDQESSWVGLGWNINPGTIGRNMRGLPDDFNGQDSITKTMNIRENVTAGVTGDFKPEVFGMSLPGKVTAGIFYNNYNGPGFEAGISPSIVARKGSLGDQNVGADTTNLGSFKFSSASGFHANPTFSARISGTNANSIDGTGNIGLNFSSRSGLEDLTLSFQGAKKYAVDGANQQSKNPTRYSSSISFSRNTYVPKVTLPFTNLQFTFYLKLGANAFGFHPNGKVGGYFSKQYIQESDRTYKVPAYGYLHYQRGNGDVHALLDFNRENDLPYSPKMPHIGVPVYTYDTYSISGEGTGGMFRPYRGDIGFVRDHQIKSKNFSGNFGLDLGVAPNIAHLGADLGFNYTYTSNKNWETENALRYAIAFREADTTFENVYFRNPSEKPVNNHSLYDALGNSDLMRVQLSDNLFLPQATTNVVRYNDQKTRTGSGTLSAGTIRTARDKRTQVISYLNASEAAKAGLDTAIVSYPLNNFLLCDSCEKAQLVNTCSNCRGVGPRSCDTVSKESRINNYRKAHHLSQITVLNPDGRTYVYGVPAYNFLQREVTFAVNKLRATPQTGLVGYQAGFDNSVSNNWGKDHFFSREETPGYAHSFLLSGVLSPDYVDVKGDGITPDDLGDAVKFNYTKLFSRDNPFRWRTPYAADSATYNEGFRSNNSDDKGSYLYGEKEIWYLNSIESKTMMATFTLEDRLDAKGVLGENGGRNGASGLKRLKRIDLYAKKDFKKHGYAARPVKSVHFAYSYRLCPGVESSVADSGKLTLDAIWFSYNGNNKGRQNPYAFRYNSLNPAYGKKDYDRWGNYKPAAANPGGMLNDEFPYATQVASQAAANAAAWTLDTIALPSGARMAIDYEADDYAFVQNRRAMQMAQIIGFSNSPNLSTAKPRLYGAGPEYDHVFINLPYAVQSTTELFQRYLQQNSKLFFRIQVRMPRDTYGEGSESVPCYAEYDDYGLCPGTTNKAWVRLKKEKNQSPLALAATQYLRLNLPSKAYPGSDVQGGSAPGSMVRILFSIVSNLSDLLLGFDGKCRTMNWANDVMVSKSLVRLNNPDYKKIGGGLRVKRVRIFDNWQKMTGQKEATYGQEYRYTTTREINGRITTISSGVATYEPSIGNEENPFHLPLEYAEKVSLLGPSFGKYIDNPVAESFFPSASVGYSKVRVLSINRQKTRSANGFQESEFYTCFDFPVKSDFTPFDNGSKRNFNSPLKYFIPDARHYLTLSQGFKIETNDMHGKMKAQATYAENDSLHPISYTRNYYLVKNQQAQELKLHTYAPILENGIQRDATMGKDIELMVDMREQRSETFGINIQLNKSTFLIGIWPVIVPIGFPKPNHAVDMYRAVTMMKVVNSYGIIDSVVHFEKGSQVSVKNMLYDPETGEPVLTKTQNGFDDPVYNFQYLSHWAYDGTGPAYKNTGALLRQQSLIEGRLSNSYNDKFFAGGDEVLATGNEGQQPCGGYLSYSTQRTTKKIWAVQATKLGLLPGIYFIDREGKAYSAINVDLKVIRSGRRNTMSSIGSIASLRSPIQNIPPFIPVFQRRGLLLGTSTRILSAGAVELSEDWKADLDSTSCTTGSGKLFSNPYVLGVLGNWRPQRSLVYYGRRAESDPAVLTNIRTNGRYADFHPYWAQNNSGNTTWLSPIQDTSRWVWNSMATLFNRKGYELENKDALGRFNSGLYGYDRTLPTAVAQNAKYREIMYEGFEDFHTGTSCWDSCQTIHHSGFSDPLPHLNDFAGGVSSILDTVEAHTGRNSLKLRYEQNYGFTIPVAKDSTFPTPLMSMTYGYVGNGYCVDRTLAKDGHFLPKFSPTAGKQVLISAWMKVQKDCNCESYDGHGHIQVYFLNSANAFVGSIQVRPSGPVIEGWQRMEMVGTVPVTATQMEIKLWANSGYWVNFDDLRIQPYNANMKTFVYHPSNLRLMAELDENNYARFYEYDDDGTLVRVKKETTKGIKTIKETRSALLKD